MTDFPVETISPPPFLGRLGESNINTTLEAEPTEPAKDTGPVLRALPTPADLQAVDIDAPARPLTTADAHQMYRSYEQAFNAAREASDEPAQVVYRLVAQLCSMGMSPAAPANVWQPLFTFDNGGRSPIAEDFRGEATTIIAGMVGLFPFQPLRHGSPTSAGPMTGRMGHPPQSPSMHTVTW